MSAIGIAPVQDGLPFGARVSGVSWDTIRDADVRAQLQRAFEEHGVLVCSDVDSTSEMQVEIASVFGPLRHHAMAEVSRADVGATATLMELHNHPEDQNVVELDGTPLAGRTPWHWDACYAPAIYRGGVLRALEMPSDGGQTGFADGVQLYQAISPKMRETFEQLDIVYDPGLMHDRQKFGLPAGYRFLETSPSMRQVQDSYEGAPRSVHPAVWQRSSGEKVLHVSPWQAAGIAGNESSEGDALLEALCQEMSETMQAYWHRWSENEIVAYDNWRMLHMVTGHDPTLSRNIHRATIEGDYGLGRAELVGAE
ncbi:MAG: TauD/TfdA family dioxygenase [Novosphingobium sp.]|nr:TauD/TfdA family dioxygenase [Novosphingobium sp.]